MHKLILDFGEKHFIFSYVSLLKMKN